MRLLNEYQFILVIVIFNTFNAHTCPHLFICVVFIMLGEGVVIPYVYKIFLYGNSIFQPILQTLLLDLKCVSVDNTVEQN